MGGKAYFYYDKGTSESVLRIALRWLGKESIFPIPRVM